MLTPNGPWCSEARRRTKGRRLVLGLLGIGHALNRLRHGLPGGFTRPTEGAPARCLARAE